MDTLAKAGIYVILDVNTPHSSITRSDASCSYNTDYLQEVFASIVEFAQFDNTLGFFAGNEVINDGPSLEAAPYVKAVVRDMKTFIKNRGFRTIPLVTPLLVSTNTDYLLVSISMWRRRHGQNRHVRY